MRRKQILLKIARVTKAIEALELDGQVKDRSPKEGEALTLLKEEQDRLVKELQLHVVGKEPESE